MSRSILALVLGSALVGALGGSAVVASAQLHPANVTIDKLRFRLIGDEPIASPDGRSIVPGLKVMVLRDLQVDQCYFALVDGTAMSMTGPGLCPQ